MNDILNTKCILNNENNFNWFVSEVENLDYIFKFLDQKEYFKIWEEMEIFNAIALYNIDNNKKSWLDYRKEAKKLIDNYFEYIKKHLKYADKGNIIIRKIIRNNINFDLEIIINNEYLFCVNRCLIDIERFKINFENILNFINNKHKNKLFINFDLDNKSINLSFEKISDKGHIFIEIKIDDLNFILNCDDIILENFVKKLSLFDNEFEEIISLYE